MTPEPYLYEAFGRLIASDILLPELTEREGEPSVRIRCAELGVSAPRDRPEWSSVEDGNVYLGWEGVGTFEVGSGQITVAPDPSASAERVRLFLLGAAMGVLLHQQGLLVLHGSAVRLGGRAAVFLGSKLGGKSTMAAALVERGGRLLSDDVVAVDFSTGIPAVLPGFAQLKLWPDALEAIGMEPDSVARIHSGLDKRDLRVESRFVREPVPLGAVFVLKKDRGISIQELTSRDALRAMVSHWYCARFDYQTLFSLGLTSQFLGSTAVVDSVSCYRLGRPPSLPRIFEIAEAVAGMI